MPDGRTNKITAPRLYPVDYGDYAPRRLIVAAGVV